MKDVLIVNDEQKFALEIYPNPDAISGNQIVVNSFSYDEVASLMRQGMPAREIIETLEPSCKQYCYDFGEEGFDLYLEYYNNIMEAGDYILIEQMTRVEIKEESNGEAVETY